MRALCFLTAAGSWRSIVALSVDVGHLCVSPIFHGIVFRWAATMPFVDLPWQGPWALLISPSLDHPRDRLVFTSEIEILFTVGNVCSMPSTVAADLSAVSG